MKNWWQSAVIYQIYPRSFKDSNGDGIGDLRGIIEKLPYLKYLGIDAIWLSPVCKSPQKDNGYDISDYRDIDPIFGTMEDMEELIKEAKRHGIQMILDLVLNHSSNEHPWFLESRKGRENPYHNYYIWRDGIDGAVPNDLQAVFGGSAWEWEETCGQYYFHQFAKEQPDLNWENPKLRQEIYDMIIWWMEKGIGGFRLDVIDQIAKEPDNRITNNGPKLHEYIRELSKNTFQKAKLITVGEAWGATPELAKLYSNPDGSELSMIFQFEHVCLDQKEGGEKWDLAPFDFLRCKQSFAKWQRELYGQGWNSLFWNNHDLARAVSRFGNDGVYRTESAKMLACVLHGMQGTPYIYQGEELGMTNPRFAIEEYRDIEIHNMYEERIQKGYDKESIMNSIYEKGRDNARTPMQWDDSSFAGFSKVPAWITVNPNYKKINSKEALENPDSIFHYYRKLIALRKQYPVFVDGRFELLFPGHPDIFAYIRTDETAKLLILANFHENTVRYEMPKDWEGEKHLLLANYEGPEDGVLRAYEACIYFRMR